MLVNQSICLIDNFAFPTSLTHSWLKQPAILPNPTAHIHIPDASYSSVYNVSAANVFLRQLMKWLYKLSHLIWPEHDISNTAREPRTPELSKRWQRRHIAHGVEGQPVPVQMSGVSDQLSATNGQVSNTFQFFQLGSVWQA